MNLPKKRGRPSISPEEKERRQKEKMQIKKDVKEHGPKKRIIHKELTGDPRKKTKTEIKTTMFILTPAGKCPVEIFSNDIESIEIWADQARNCKRYNEYHTFQSLRHWLQGFFEVFSDEYKVAVENLKMACRSLEIVDYSKQLEKEYKDSQIRVNLLTIEKYIEEGEV